MTAEGVVDKSRLGSESSSGGGVSGDIIDSGIDDSDEGSEINSTGAVFSRPWFDSSRADLRTCLKECSAETFLC